MTDTMEAGVRVADSTTTGRLDGRRLPHSDDEDAAGRSVAMIDGFAQHEGYRAVHTRAKRLMVVTTQ